MSVGGAWFRARYANAKGRGGGRGRGLVWNRRDGIGPAIRHENRSITGTCYYGERSFPFSLSLFPYSFFLFQGEKHEVAKTGCAARANISSRLTLRRGKSASVFLTRSVPSIPRSQHAGFRTFLREGGREGGRKKLRSRRRINSWEVWKMFVSSFQPLIFFSFGNARNSVLLLLLLREYYFDSWIFVSSRRDIYIDPKRRLSVFEHRTGIEYFLFLIIFE